MTRRAKLEEVVVLFLEDFKHVKTTTTTVTKYVYGKFVTIQENYLGVFLGARTTNGLGSAVLFGRTSLEGRKEIRG